MRRCLTIYAGTFIVLVWVFNRRTSSLLNCETAVTAPQDEQGVRGGGSALPPPVWQRDSGEEAVNHRRQAGRVPDLGERPFQRGNRTQQPAEALHVRRHVRCGLDSAGILRRVGLPPGGERASGGDQLPSLGHRATRTPPRTIHSLDCAPPRRASTARFSRTGRRAAGRRTPCRA